MPDINAEFRTIALDALEHDHESYLRATGREFWVAGLVRSSGEFVPLYGELPESILQHVAPDVRAAYGVNAPVPTGAPRGDLLLISSEHYAEGADPELRLALLLHEACHLIIEAKLPRVALDEIDSENAADILPLLHPDMDDWHDEEFVTLLSAACRRLRTGDDAKVLLKLAMRYDIYEDDDEEWEPPTETAMQDE